jgi:hypothetical protein
LAPLKGAAISSVETARPPIILRFMIVPSNSQIPSCDFRSVRGCAFLSLDVDHYRPVNR